MGAPLDVGGLRLQGRLEAGSGDLLPLWAQVPL